MKCPRCNSEGFVPTEENPRCLENIGGKTHYETFDIRRYLCHNCQFPFYTYEQYHKPIGNADITDISKTDNVSTPERPDQLNAFSSDGR